MKISTKGRYALRLMMDIAVHSNGEMVALKDVARRQEISVKYLEQIVGLLSKAGFLRSSRGPQGGYRLSRRPEEYTVGEILRLTEGNLAPVSCLEDEENQCSRCRQCGTLDFWTGLYRTVNSYIDRYTLADLVRSEEQKKQDGPAGGTETERRSGI
ncbi:Rrf2 family transcriptional regulator [Oscillibacter sp. MSJ-2]|uniref:Rrf2 family transcriptional regulator n=1 Tax=Dysosmobacter acutus TaxID=2841504 RepID=A0ABS6FBC1_9FIRM|nr:Rrf2 family transcriptional regulator [Dysosmobacter acutus]MBU5627574.1 Rrf2 family transcriptional regulator [Dysosmobacter acutus]